MPKNISIEIPDKISEILGSGDEAAKAAIQSLVSDLVHKGMISRSEAEGLPGVDEITSVDSYAKIHPVVIFPFVWRAKETADAQSSKKRSYVNRDLQELYSKLLPDLVEEKETYARPITVMDWKTYLNNVKYKFAPPEWKESFEDFCRDYIEKYSTLIKAWCVDTCQMWNTGLGAAFENGADRGIYWLIPGDFNYSQKEDVLETMKELPKAIQGGQDLCVGQISVEVNNSKQLIDTYGTYGLLYNWFPHEAQEIRKITDKPRSEFFAIRGSFLEEVLRQRWYPYEQTIVILLQAIANKKRIAMVKLGDISDLPEGRETVAAAMQQVERTERVLKLVWREGKEHEQRWIDDFRILDQQSEQIRGAALVILRNLLQ